MKTKNPSRHLSLSGSYNIRDLGGYLTEDGRTTRWRTFLRSGSMHSLTSESQSRLLGLGIRTVVDLRTSVEKHDFPNVFAKSTRVSFRQHNMIGDVTLETNRDVTAVDMLEGGGEFAEGIFTMYRTFLDGRQEQIRDILTTLSEPDALPAIYHCAGGKDRTGIISAILLANAGVPYDTIANDYALSARYLMERYFDDEARPGETPENFTWREYQVKFCPPESMLMTLSYLDKVYGGVPAYMRVIGLDSRQIDRLRDSVIE